MARQIARNVAVAAAFIAGSASFLAAQPRMNRGPNPDAPKLMVSACRAADKALGTLCADRIRSQIEGDVSFRTLVVMSKADVENTLVASGYDPALALAPGDAVALAKQLLSDFYIDASVEQTGSGFKLTAAAVLARDPNMKQPLGTYEHARLETIAGQVSKAFQEVFNKTFDKQKECFIRERERRYDVAAKAAADGIRDYPNSAWLRHCKLALLKSQKAPGPEVTAVLEEITEMDPSNRSALQDLVIIYDAAGNREKKLETLEQLRQADPTNPRLTADIVNELAAMGLFDRARPIVEKAVAENPGDINLVRPYWLILMSAREYKQAVEVGKQMAAMDTATADSSFYDRMIRAANADSNYREAANLAERAMAKFPKVPEFAAYAVTLNRLAGDPARSVAAARRALQTDPTTKNVRSLIANVYLKREPVTPADADSAIAIAREMIQFDEDKDQIAGVAVTAGNLLRVWVDTLKARSADGATVLAAAERAYSVMAWADSLARGTAVANEGKFVMGVAALGVGQLYLNKAGEGPNKVITEIRAMRPMPDAARQQALLAPSYAEACGLVKKANEYFTTAQGAVPAGGRFNPQAAQQVMGSLMQLNGYVDQMTKAYCK